MGFLDLKEKEWKTRFADAKVVDAVLCGVSTKADKRHDALSPNVPSIVFLLIEKRSLGSAQFVEFSQGTTKQLNGYPVSSVTLCNFEGTRCSFQKFAGHSSSSAPLVLKPKETQLRTTSRATTSAEGATAVAGEHDAIGQQKRSAQTPGQSADDGLPPAKKNNLSELGSADCFKQLSAALQGSKLVPGGRSLLEISTLFTACCGRSGRSGSGADAVP